MTHVISRNKPGRNGSTREVVIMDPDIERELLKSSKRYLATTIFIAVMIFLILVIQALNFIA